jgi:hypothetical protein
MGADEIVSISLENNAAPAVLEAAATVTTVAESLQIQEKAETQAAKPKEDDGYGELFLF